MQCHHCEREGREKEAAFAAEHDGVRVGLCEDHFREQLDAMTDDEAMEELRERVDIDRQD